MSGSFGALNTKYNILLNELRNKTGTPGPPGPTTSDLADVLLNGNSAGATDIDMNNQDILQVNNIDLVTINGSAYPPVVSADTLSDVLTAGNIATNSITLNNTGVGTNVINLLPNFSANNPHITLTDGTTTNTIDKNGYTTRNTSANTAHFLNFSDASTTGTGAIQKTTAISCNPSTKSISLGPSTINSTVNVIGPSSMNMTPSVGTTSYNQSLTNWRMADSTTQYTNINTNNMTITDGTDTGLYSRTLMRLTSATSTSQLQPNVLNISNPTGTASASLNNGALSVIDSTTGDSSSFSRFRALSTDSTNGTNFDFQNNGRGFLTGIGVGYNSTPQFTITNINVSAGATTGVPAIKFSKTGRNAVAGDVITSQHFYANNSAGTSTEFARMEASVRNTAVGNDDGSIAFSGLINGVMTEFFRVNGADSENNMFLPLDMNGQSIKTNSGNLTISATSSAGTGTITIAPKVAGNLIFQNLPTSAVGLPTGAVWNNLGVLSIAP